MEVPLCGRCTLKVTSARGLWLVVSIALGLTVTVGGALALEAFGVRSEPVVMTSALGLIALGIVVTVFSARFGWKRHAERWLPVQLAPSKGERQDHAQGEITLLFHDADTAHEVAALSGLTDGSTDYRHTSNTAGYEARGSIFLGLVPLLFAAVSVWRGWCWFSGGDLISVFFLESLLFDLFGSWGPSLFWGFGTLIFAGFFLGWCTWRWSKSTP